MAVVVNGDGILTGISSLTTALTDLTSGRGTVTGVATVGTLQLGAGVSISSPRSQNAAIFTNNSEFLTVDDAGRVGVGTITPNSDVHPQNVGKINVGFITARSIAGDIDANTMVVAGVSTFVGAINGTLTGTASGNAVLTGSTNNTLVTVTGANAITGESNLTYTSGATFDIKGSGEGGPRVYRDQGNGPDITLHGSKGTIASPSASGLNDLVGNINFAGHDGTSYHRRASINGIIDGTVVDGSDTLPTAIKFETGTTNKTEKMRLDSSGRLLIGHSTGNGYPQLSVSGNTAGASGAGMLFLRRGLDRTTIGGNVGADLGAVEFGDLDGNIYASIQGKTGAATSSDSDVPGRIILATVKDGTNTMQEKVRIDHESTVAFFHNGTNHVTVSGTSQCNGVGAGPSPAAVCFAVGRDSGTSRSAHFAGHIQMASGYGIDFSPTGDASGITPSAEVLDEYEEGIATFQLHINGGEASGVSYSYNTGPYTRIGRLVFCQISMFATNLPADTGGIDITGLPFVDGGGGGYRESAFIAGNHSLGTNPSVIFGAIHGSGSKIRLRKYGSGDLDGSDIGSTFWMHGSITYNTT